MVMMMMNVINLMIINIIQNDLRIEFNASTLTFFLLFEEVVWIIRLVFFSWLESRFSLNAVLSFARFIIIIIIDDECIVILLKNI